MLNLRGVLVSILVDVATVGGQQQESQATEHHPRLALLSVPEQQALKLYLGEMTATRQDAVDVKVCCSVLCWKLGNEADNFDFAVPALEWVCSEYEPTSGLTQALVSPVRNSGA